MPTESKTVLTESDLSHFTGSENYYRIAFSKIVITDGVHFVREKAQSYWLVDKIAALQHEQKIAKCEFQVWKLKVDNQSAVLTMKEDSDQPDIYSEKIDYTDFPLAEITFWLANQVLYLPSEH